MKPRFVLAAILALLCALFQLGAVPILDEESYLDIGAQIAGHPWAPYDWWRPWQPWGAEHPENAYLYAHPPGHLWWVAASQALGGGLLTRLAAGVPLAALLGYSAGALSERLGGWLAVGIIAGSPILWLSLQTALMPDLGVTALATAAVAAWVYKRPALAGAALAAACSWKYPALVLLLPLGWLARKEWRLWAGFAPFVVLQLALTAVYGEPHLTHVLATADEIGRGPLGSRALGTLFRLGLAGAPAWTGPASVFALIGAPLAFIPELDEGRLTLIVLGVLGSLALLRATVALREGPIAQLLGAWVLLVVLGVVFGHNYAGGRYLLPAVVPLGLLAATHLKGHLRFLALPTALLAPAMLFGERASMSAADELAQATTQAHPPGHFTGEWTFRWRMQEEGWTFWSPGEPLPTGTLLAVPTHSSPGPIPPGLELVDERVTEGAGGLRLTDLEVGIGYHAETLGPLPVGFGTPQREIVMIYRAP
ncbi:MAG: hypothetical protein GY913_05165 [Proteobacteria bacterium]|nr:hypothetical protein [Pseudomonadota bacterium]MCP4916291.1 hypothetical protein [Pseudomonadota bacterium]